MLQLFRTNHIFAVILGFSFVFIWHSSVYFNIPEWEPSQSGILMQEIELHFGHAGIAARLIVIFLLGIQYGFANHLINSYRLADTSTVFPGIFVILFSCYAPYFLFLSVFHILNTLFIILLFILFGTYNQPKTADHLFNIGLLAGISFLFFPPAFYLIAIIFIGASILRTYLIKERIIVLIGFLIPSFWAGSGAGAVPATGGPGNDSRWAGRPGGRRTAGSTAGHSGLDRFGSGDRGGR